MKQFAVKETWEILADKSVEAPDVVAAVVAFALEQLPWWPLYVSLYLCVSISIAAV